ncbi:MAG: hypothetical protein ACRD1X_07570 [Vicinamibacteria bacterium]
MNLQYSFVLVLSGVSEPDEWLENALFEAGCDDGTLAFRDGVGTSISIDGRRVCTPRFVQLSEM